MPNYDYKCQDCDYAFELFQKMTDSPIEVCPNCKGKVKRLIGAGAGPIFKGSGFYQTDYKNKTAGNKSNSRTGNGTESKQNKVQKENPTTKSV